MSSYWYSTNGLLHRRLPSHHLNVLDQAYEKRARIQIFDEEIFGLDIPAIANPYQGTMTAGDIHYGLYRQPPMWRMSDSSLNGLSFLDDESDTTKNKKTKKINGFLQKRGAEESCDCCTIS